MKKNQFVSAFKENGFVILENIVSHNFVQQCVNQVEVALAKEEKYLIDKNLMPNGYVLSNAKYAGVFWEIFNIQELIDPLEWIMGKNCIIYSYTSSSMPPGSGNPSSKIHVDCPIFASQPTLRVAMLLALTDFTVENGATRFLPKSHTIENKPSDKLFFNNSTVLNIKAGSAWYFDTRLWHSGGFNKTNAWRHALTMNICHPWMKQYIDIPRLLSDIDTTNMSFKAKQKLGFYSQPPSNYDEYYDAQRKRLFI